MGNTKTVSENGNRDEIKYQTEFEFLFGKKKEWIFRILVWELGKGARQRFWNRPVRDQKSQFVVHSFDEKKQIQVSVATPYLCLYLSLQRSFNLHRTHQPKPLHTHQVAPHRSYSADLKTAREIIPLPSVCFWPGLNSGLYQMCALNFY